MSIGSRIKQIVGIEGDTKEALVPMLAYNAEALSSSGSSQLTALYYQQYLDRVEGLGTARAGVVLLFKSLWDAVIDPFLGLMADRTRSKWGRHRIYILLGAIPFGLAFFMIWNSFGLSSGAGEGRVMRYYIFANILYTGVSSFITVPHTAMLPEIAPGYFQRTQFKSVEYIMNFLGMSGTFLLAGAFLGVVKTQDFTPALRPTFLKMGLILGVVFIFPTLACALLTKEKSSKNMLFPPVDLKYLLNEYRLVFRNRAWVQYFLMSLLYLLSVSFFASSRQYFLYETADAASQMNLLNLFVGIAEPLAFPLNYALTKKFGKAKMAWFTTPFLLLSLGLVFVTGRQGPGGGIPWMTVSLFAQEMLHPFGISGIAFSAQNIQPDTTDVDELITGRRREGVIATFSAFVKQSAQGLVQFFIGVLLEWFGVEARAGDKRNVLFQARAATLLGPKWGGPDAGTRFVHGFLPLAFAALSLLALRKYKMTKHDHELIRRVIAQRHAQGHAEVTEAERAKLEEIAGQKWEHMWVGSCQRP
ncbi:MAG: MFS transporter [Oscillospiraceae bacterium]|nr:MFS transporter [Oscillospiraceae bacterium]